MLDNKVLIAMFHVELNRNGKLENALEFLIELSKTEGRSSVIKEMRMLAEISQENNELKRSRK